MNIEDMILYFTNHPNLHSPNEALEKLMVEKILRGIYAWYFNKLPYSVIPGISVHYRNHDLLYVGIAPSLRKGVPSNSTLRSRLMLHSRRNIQSSTLRKSLACLLDLEMEKRGKSQKPKLVDKNTLTTWINDHAKVAWFPCEIP
jgi:hypothetical protein